MAVQSVSLNVGAGFKPAQRNQAYIDKALLEKKYWDDLLEKLRKSGGGGGGSDPRFDRIAVSMQLSNFLSNKQIKAIFNNFTKEFLTLANNILNQIQSSNKNVFVSDLQKIGKMFLNGLQNVISFIIRRDVATLRLYNASQHLLSLIGVLSFQLNKLKKILEKDLKELIGKLNLISDFFDYILTNLKKN